MGYPIWPLDQALLLPLRRQLPSRLIVSPMEDAAPKVRLERLAAAGKMDGSLRLTGTEWADLLAWGEVALSDWSTPFLWIDPMDGMGKEMLFLLEPGPPTLEGDASDVIDPESTVWLVPASLAVID
jgi:hypothetical protein